MRAGLTASVITHLAVFAAGFIAFSDVERFDPTPVESIPIELIPIETVASIRLGSLDSELIETPTPSAVEAEQPAELAQPTGNTQEDQPRPEDAFEETPAPTVNTAPEPQPLPEPEPEPIPEPTPPPLPPAPEPEPEPEPVAPPLVVEETPVLAVEETPDPTPLAPVPPPVNRTVETARQRFAALQEERRQEQARQQTNEPDEISSIINNEESRGAVTGEGGEQSAGKATGTASRLTRSELDALAAQMRRCWSPPFAALNEEGLTVRLIVDLDTSGRPIAMPRIMTAVTTPLVEATAKAAQRAIVKCGPYALDPAKYAEWQQVDVTFDPKDLR